MLIFGIKTNVERTPREANVCFIVARTSRTCSTSGLGTDGATVPTVDSRSSVMATDITSDMESLIASFVAVTLSSCERAGMVVEVWGDCGPVT